MARHRWSGPRLTRLPVKGKRQMVKFYHTPHYEPRQAGDVFFHRGQRYEVVRLEPHRRRDGSLSELVVFTSRCADCGAVFEAKSPNKLVLYPNRRCKRHAKPMVPAGGPRNPRRKRKDAHPPVVPSITPQQVGEIIAQVAEGCPDGERWTARLQDDRGVPRLLVTRYGQSRAQALTVVASWLDEGIFETRAYRSKRQRKERQGLFLGPAASVFG